MPCIATNFHSILWCISPDTTRWDEKIGIKDKNTKTKEKMYS
jgi:hypothetical protein